MTKDVTPNRKALAIVMVYPIGVFLVGFVLNSFVFGVDPLIVVLPSKECIYALVICAVLLVINHTWLMTTTETTRVRYHLLTTPEEWAASGNCRQNASEEGLQELERRHNAHRNLTENVVYFIFLATVFSWVSPTTLAAQVWLIGFAVARLGYTFSYLTGKDQTRGIFMSLSLIAMYGMASYLGMSLVI